MFTGVTLRSFAYVDNSGMERTLDLSSDRKYKSREACGVWVFPGSNQAWKTFSSTKQYNQMTAAYASANANGVPTPEFYFILGTAICDRGRRRDGFALVSTNITSGRSFALKNGTGSFERIINSINNVDVVWRVEEALRVAISIGLTDPQGFIDTTSATNPIWFIDIHTSTGSPWYLQKVYELASKRRTALQQ